VAHRDDWAPLYARAAAAIRAGDGDMAAVAVDELARVQEREMRGEAP
jgi:hypothetical protein